MVKLTLTKIAYLGVFLVLPMLIAPFSWWIVLPGFVTMHLTAGIFMTIVFQMAHLVEEAEQPSLNGQGTIENEWTIHELKPRQIFPKKAGFSLG
jgi:linoleoyl-CoA desaturase